MDRKKAKLYLMLAAALFYLAGLITLLARNEESGAIGWMFIVLGSMQLTLIAALQAKQK